MGILLFKLCYKKLNALLAKNVEDAKLLIDGLEEKKVRAEKRLDELRSSLKNASVNVEKAVFAAEEEAKKITEKSSERVKSAVLKLQEEYETTIEKIRYNLSLELQNKVVSLIIGNMSKKLCEAQTDRSIQNKNIDHSIKMLEGFANEHSLESRE
jgi:F0F1-type ATP synthase membrane subunit b/b'